MLVRCDDVVADTRSVSPQESPSRQRVLIRLVQLDRHIRRETRPREPREFQLVGRDLLTRLLRRTDQE